MANSDQSRRSSKKKKTKTTSAVNWGFIGKCLVIIFLVALLGGLTYGAKLLADAKNTVNDAYRPLPTDSKNDNIDPLKDPISILVMGIDDDDERALGSARTDTMIVVTINPENSQISMVSLPRDTYTYIDTPSYKGMDKINASYTYGTDEGAIKAVEHLLDIPINYYLTVDFIAFEKVIDALGGIEIDVPFDIHQHYASEDYTDGPVIINKGKQTLNGENALVFARMRKVDTDIERGKRGQLVIEQTIKKATDLGSLTKYSDVIQAINGHFWTNMPPKTMQEIAQSGLTKHYTFHSYAFSWMSFDYPIHGGISNMVGLHEDSLAYISHKLRLSLGLDQPDERDAEGYQFVSNEKVSPKTYPKDWDPSTASDGTGYDNYNSQTYNNDYTTGYNENNSSQHYNDNYNGSANVNEQYNGSVNYNEQNNTATGESYTDSNNYNYNDGNQ